MDKQLIFQGSIRLSVAALATLLFDLVQVDLAQAADERGLNLPVIDNPLASGPSTTFIPPAIPHLPEKGLDEYADLLYCVLNAEQQAAAGQPGQPGQPSNNAIGAVAGGPAAAGVGTAAPTAAAPAAPVCLT